MLAIDVSPRFTEKIPRLTASAIAGSAGAPPPALVPLSLQYVTVPPAPTQRKFELRRPRKIRPIDHQFALMAKNAGNLARRRETSGCEQHCDGYGSAALSLGGKRTVFSFSFSLLHSTQLLRALVLKQDFDDNAISTITGSACQCQKPFSFTHLRILSSALSPPSQFCNISIKSLDRVCCFAMFGGVMGQPGSILILAAPTSLERRLPFISFHARAPRLRFSPPPSPPPPTPHHASRITHQTKSNLAPPFTYHTRRPSQKCLINNKERKASSTRAAMIQVNEHILRMKQWILAASLTLAALTVTARDDSYSVPKDHPKLHGVMPPEHLGVATPSKEVSWATPAAWTQLKPTPIAIGNFSVTVPGVGLAEVAITSFPGSVGTELDNVNRWRAEVGLDALAPDKLASQTRRDRRSARQGFTTSPATPPPPSSPASPATAPPGSSSCAAIKAAVAAARATFITFLASIQFHAPQTAAAPADPSPPPAAPAPAPAAGPNLGDALHLGRNRPGPIARKILHGPGPRRPERHRHHQLLSR